MERWLKFTGGIPSARLFSCLVCVAVAATAAFAAPRARPTPVPKHSAYPTPYGAIVPAGVDVPVVLTTQINSATFEVGDSFEFHTAKDIKLGDVDVPKDTPGHGRIARVVHANKDHNGDVSLQVDSIDLPDGMPIWVNIDPKSTIHGHLADRHTRFFVVALSTDYSGNMVLEPGTAFSVTTIARRAGPAPLLTATPLATADAIAAPSSVPAVAPSPVLASPAVPTPRGTRL